MYIDIYSVHVCIIRIHRKHTFVTCCGGAFSIDTRVETSLDFLLVKPGSSYCNAPCFRWSTVFGPCDLSQSPAIILTPSRPVVQALDDIALGFEKNFNRLRIVGCPGANEV